MMKERFVLASCLVLVAILAVSVPVAKSDPLEKCQARNTSYNIGDSKQCDKYWVCTEKGELLERLCDDGFVHSLQISQCDYPHNVDCSLRPILQPTKSTHPNCPRSNGFYAFPAAESCQNFYHCLEGQAYEKTCPEGVIFDPSKGTCIHPDMSKRVDCAAKEVLHFICPNSLNRFAKLKFGDHDRHSHPEDCRKFFICLKSGKPRVGGCPLGKVFNGKTGYCDEPKRVEGCTNYYGDKDIAKLLHESDSEGFDFDGDSTNNVDDYPTSHKNSSFNSKDKKVQQAISEATGEDIPQPKPVNKILAAKVSKRHIQDGQQEGRRHGLGEQQQGFGQPQGYRRPQEGFGQSQQVFGPQQYQGISNPQRRYRQSEEGEEDDDEHFDIKKQKLSRRATSKDDDHDRDHSDEDTSDDED